VLNEPVLELSSGPFAIRVQLFGGEDSRHETEQAFLSSLEALEGEKPPRKLGVVIVDGKKRPLYARRWTKSGSDRISDKPPMKRDFSEEFVLVPAGGKFLTLKFVVRDAPPPEAVKRAKLAWKKNVPLETGAVKVEKTRPCALVVETRRRPWNEIVTGLPGTGLPFEVRVAEAVNTSPVPMVTS